MDQADLKQRDSTASNLTLPLGRLTPSCPAGHTTPAPVAAWWRLASPAWRVESGYSVAAIGLANPRS
jgi:hypothetical protein